MNDKYHEFIMNILDILPALFGMSITGSLLVYFFNQYERSRKIIIILSFLFIASGFTLQIFDNNSHQIDSWLEERKNIFSFPIISAIIGTFAVNKLLKYIADTKEKREMGILFRETINLQIRNLKFMQDYIWDNKKRLKSIPDDIEDSIKRNQKLITISRNNLDNKFIDLIFQKIGIFNKDETETFSRYIMHLKNTLCYVDQVLISTSNEFNPLILKYSIHKTLLIGLLAKYKLDIHYAESSYLTLRDDFICEYEYYLKDSLNLFKYPSIHYKYFTNSKVFIDLIKTLKYIRSEFQRINIYNDIKNNKLYICRINTKNINDDLDPIFSKDSVSIIHLIPDDEFIACLNETNVNLNLEDEGKKIFQNFIKQRMQEITQNYPNNNLNENDYEYEITNKILNKLTIEIVTPWGK